MKTRGKKLDGTLRRVIVAVLVAGIGGTRPAPAEAVVATAGACVLELELTANVTVPVVPDPDDTVVRTWTMNEVPAKSWCVATSDPTAGVNVTGTLQGLESLPFGCTLGAFSGMFTIDVDAVGYPSLSGAATAVVAGGVASLAATGGGSPPTFAAAGAFVQEPFDVKACHDAAGTTAMTWTGAVVFEDPQV